MKDKILSLLGLIKRANRLILGEAILNQFKNVKFLFIASDASEKSKERYLKKCNYYNVPYNLSFTTDELSHALGKNNVKVIGVVDDGFKKAIIKEIERGCNYGETSEEKIEQ